MILGKMIPGKMIPGKMMPGSRSLMHEHHVLAILDYRSQQARPDIRLDEGTRFGRWISLHMAIAAVLLTRFMGTSSVGGRVC